MLNGRLFVLVFKNALYHKNLIILQIIFKTLFLNLFLLNKRLYHYFLFINNLHNQQNYQPFYKYPLLLFIMYRLNDLLDCNT